MKKIKIGIVVGIVVLFIGAGVVPITSGYIGNKKDIYQINDQGYSPSSLTDWWPMFHHDLNHNGYSTSTAPNTNSISWTYKTDGPIISSPAVVDGKVYFGGNLGKVYCLNAANGNWIWDYTTGDMVEYSSPAVVDGKVYFGSLDYKVYCLNADTGAKIWDYTTGNWVDSSPAVVDGKVYIGSGDYKLYCLNAANGNWIWDYTTGGGVDTSPAVADGKVYFGSGDYKVYCLNADTGAKIWDHPIGSTLTRSSPAVANGKVYIGAYDHKLYCLNAATGQWIWDYTTGNIVYSSPAVADGKVYIGGSEDFKVYCLNADTGAKIWDYTTGYNVESSPAIADGKVYICSYDYKMYCFGTKVGPDLIIRDRSTGSLILTGDNIYEKPGTNWLGVTQQIGKWTFQLPGLFYHWYTCWIMLQNDDPTVPLIGHTIETFLINGATGTRGGLLYRNTGGTFTSMPIGQSTIDGAQILPGASRWLKLTVGTPNAGVNSLKVGIHVISTSGAEDAIIFMP